MTPSATIVRAKEQTESTLILRDADDESNSPNYESQSYRDQKGDVKKIRDVYEGTPALRDGGEEYLPKHPMEQQHKYEDRVKIALAYNATKRTASGLVGMVFRRDPTVEDAEGDMEADLEDVDLQGRALPVFMRAVADNALIDGHTWLHIEEPKVDESIRTSQQAEDAGVRPYWINITKTQAHNWRYETRAGRPVLTLFCYRETSSMPDGDFGESTTRQVRVLREGQFEETGVRGNARGELWEFSKAEGTGKDQWARIEEYEIGVMRIPVVCVYGERTGVFTSSPPLMDIAYEQIEHYRVRSERQKALTYAAISVPYGFGKDMVDGDGNPKVKWGSDGMMLSNDSEAQAGMIESSGNGLSALKEELQEIQARMASLGLQLIARSNQAQGKSDRTTATSDVLSKSEGDAWLVTFAISLEDATNEALAIHAEYRKLSKAPTLKINRDFHDQLIDAARMKELREFYLADIIPIEDVWDALKRGEILDEAFDFDDARKRLNQAREDRLKGMVDSMGGETETEEAA